MFWFRHSKPVDSQKAIAVQVVKQDQQKQVNTTVIMVERPDRPLAERISDSELAVPSLGSGKTCESRAEALL